MRITYFANDLSDAAVARRVRMLRIGGAEVKLIGFHRSIEPIREVEGIAPLDLGRTFDGRFVDRSLQVLQRSLEARNWQHLVSGADVLLAKNLDMVTIADAARSWAGLDVRLAYECLDINGTLLGKRLPARVLRCWERRALRRSAALIVSSKSFLANHFDRLGVELPDIIVAENKRVLLHERSEKRPQNIFGSGPPWKIGWFGIIRCIESFQVLMSLARLHPGLVVIEMRGRPTQTLHNLINKYLPLENMRYGGPYEQAELASIYQDCHLTWAIDYSQQGQNSDWLLPNRIYEGGYYNSPPIALDGTETGSWLRAHQAGIVLTDPKTQLDAFVIGLTTDKYRVLRRASADIPTCDLVWTTEDCRRFTRRVVGANF